MRVVIVNIPPVIFILTFKRSAIIPARARNITEAVMAKACAVQQNGQNALITNPCMPMNQIPAPITANAQSVSAFNDRIFFLFSARYLNKLLFKLPLNE